MTTERNASPRRVIAAGLLIISGLVSVALADLDVAIGNNSVVDAELAPADEVETYRITVAGGSKVAVTAKAKPEKKATPLDLRMVVLDAGDNVVATGVAKGKSVKVRGFVPETTGVYRIVVTGEGAITGAYQLKAKWKSPKKVKAEIEVGETGSTATFAASPKSLATLKVKAARKSAALPRMTRVASQDDVFEFLAFDPPKSETKKNQKQKRVLLGPQRDYVLSVDNAGAPGGVLVDVALKAPKAAKVTVDVRDPSIGGGNGSTGASGGKPAVAFGGVIGPEGGAVQVDAGLGGILGGTGIVVPAGALSSPVAITFGEAVNPLPSPDGQLSELGPTVFFGPEGLEFGIPATVTIPFDVGALAAGVDTVAIYARDEDGTVSLIPPPYVFDVDAGTCSFPASHFTSFRAFQFPPFVTFENEEIIIPQDSLGGDQVGASVALHADTLVFGAPSEDSAASGAGAVYVYIRNGSTWSFEAKLTASDATLSAAFGTDVAIVGDALVVGAPGAQSRSGVTGAAYTFFRSQGQWFENQKLVGSQTNNGDRFGESLDYDGTTLIIGSPAESQGTGLGTAGAVYTYEPLDGLLEIERLTQTSPNPGERFGSAVALGSNNRIVVGAPGSLIPGRAFIFDRDPQQQLGSQWAQTAELAHGEATGEEDFGAAVDMDGDIAVVGDPRFDDASAANSGRAWVFELGAAWDLVNHIAPPVAEAGSRFGESVSMEAEGIIVGNPGRDAPGVGAAGAFHAFGRLDTVFQYFTGRFADVPVVQENMGTDVFLLGTEVVVGGTGIVQTTGTVFVYDIVSLIGTDQ